LSDLKILSLINPFTFFFGSTGVWHLLGRHSTAWAIPLAFMLLAIFFQIGSWVFVQTSLNHNPAT
jgi:hypothetical protein